ncbi:hydantoin utilization protein A [Brevibacillus parabrevis]|uniref:hydrogenase nickel incorporation protein HypB n=1 Tax=Brevibacillus parabrevis TaxID=54914 RepID=UPI0007ABD3B4|nr:hydrogenase nickel incorporation protein HypB [Brevibacillus parabrevis]KZE43345.1 hydantoin utilization protein A [Brevibacillus parabrevis]
MNKRLYLQHQVLQGNEEIARQNRELFRKHSVLVINMIGSPGAGKTTLLEHMISQVKKTAKLGVIEGDVETTIDSERIARYAIPTVQINTHGACHLDARMIADVTPHFSLSDLDVLLIENVGNLVCPTEFDLGEKMRIVVLSTAEGADKVQKYPAVFQQADAIVLSKTDLLPYVPFDLDKFYQELALLNQRILIFPVSALHGEGVKEFVEWLIQKRGDFQWKG